MSASNHTNPRSTNTTSLHRISSSDHGRKSAEFDEVSFENLTFVDDYVACGVYEDRSRDNYHHEENHNDSDDDDDIDENYDTEEFFEEEDEVPELTELELLELAVQRGSGIAGLNYQTATKLASATQTITREAIAGKDVQPSLNKNRSPNKDRRPGQRVLSQRSSFSHRSQEEIEPRSNRARSNHEVGRYARPIAPLRIKSVRVNSETDDCEDDSGDYNGDYHQEFAEQDSGDLTADSFASLEHQSPRR